MKRFFFNCLLVFFTFSLFGEDITFNEVKIIHLEDKPISIQIPYEEALALVFDGNHTFLQGIEIEIKQSNVSLYLPNSIEYQVYKTSDKIDESTLNYNATLIEKKLLPMRLSTILQIPTREKHSLKNSAYSSVIPSAVTPLTEALILKLVPNIKDLPADFEQNLATITVKPIYTREGGISLKVQYPKEETKLYTTLNDVPFEIPITPDYAILPVGEYTLIVQADEYRTELRNIRIQQAKVLTVDITLRSIMPLLCVYVPKEVEVYLDRKKIDPEISPMEISIGSHTIKLQLGNYEILRQIDAEEGKTYTLTMDIGFDLNIED